MQRSSAMKSSINGPLSGSVPLTVTVEMYVLLLKRITRNKPSGALARLYSLNTGIPFVSEDTNQPQIGEADLLRYYQFRLRDNAATYVKVMCDYLLARLTMLDDIPQTRGSLDLNTEKAIRFYYNLSAHSAREILDLTARLRRGHELTYNEFEALCSRIDMEAISTFNQIGMISPNPRCDGAVKCLIQTIAPELIKFASKTQHPTQAYARILTTFAAVVRLYFGAVNTRDRDHDKIGNNIGPIVYEKTGEPLRISNDVVACLPSPDIHLLQGFHDPGAAVISPEAQQYVIAQANPYLRRT